MDGCLTLINDFFSEKTGWAIIKLDVDFQITYDYSPLDI